MDAVIEQPVAPGELEEGVAEDHREPDDLDLPGGAGRLRGRRAGRRRSRRRGRSIAAAPSVPPMAISEVEAKKAVPFCRPFITCVSTMRLSRAHRLADPAGAAQVHPHVQALPGMRTDLDHVVVADPRQDEERDCDDVERANPIMRCSRPALDSFRPMPRTFAQAAARQAAAGRPLESASSNRPLGN